MEISLLPLAEKNITQPPALLAHPFQTTPGNRGLDFREEGIIGVLDDL